MMLKRREALPSRLISLLRCKAAALVLFPQAKRVKNWNGLAKCIMFLLYVFRAFTASFNDLFLHYGKQKATSYRHCRCSF